MLEVGITDSSFNHQSTRVFATDDMSQVLNHMMSHPSPHFQVFGTLIKALPFGPPEES